MSTILTVRLGADAFEALRYYARKHAGGSHSAAAAQIIRKHLKLPEPSQRGGQDRETGAAAVHWGEDAVGMVAKVLGATKVTSERGNLYRNDGRLVLIKNARGKGDRVNVLVSMRDRYTVLYAGFWDEGGTKCDVFQVSATDVAKHARIVTHGKMMQLDRGTLERLGCPSVRHSWT
jgi:hypothetical protein